MGADLPKTEKTEVCTTIIHTPASVCVCVCVEPHGLRPPTVKVDECVTARVQPNWSGNIVACVGGAASAAVAAACGGTCWFTRDKQTERGWVGGKRKMKHDFLFSQQQHPDFQAAVLFFFSLAQHNHLFNIAGMNLKKSNDIEKKPSTTCCA